MKIDVYSDMVCPWCYIGKTNMTRAIDEWEQLTGEKPEVVYHAYQLDPDVEPEGRPFKSHMSRKFGGEDKLPPMLNRVTEAGAAVGVEFRFDRVTRMPNTLLAHRVTALLPKEQQTAWVDAVMRSYFTEGRDIASREVLLDIAGKMAVGAVGTGKTSPSVESESAAGKEAGNDAAVTSALSVEELERRLDAGEGAEAVEADLSASRAMGITGVPFFVIDNKYALSGAYPPEQFLAAFRRIVQESNG